MKNLKKDLMAISKSVSKLAEKMEKIAEAIEKGAEPAKPVTKKKAAPKAAKKKATPPKKQAQKAADSPDAKGSESMLDNIFEMVSSNPEGITVAQIKEKTGLAPRQVSNALYKLTKKGKVETVSRGIYVEKKS